MSSGPSNTLKRPLIVKIFLVFAMGLLILFCWHNAHFQYDVYSDSDIPLLIYRCSLLSIFFWLAIALRGRYAPNFVIVGILYSIIILFYFFANYMTGGSPNLRASVEAILVVFAMLPIISDRWMLNRLVVLNFALGIVLIAFNSVTILHWLQIITLDYVQVPRYASVKDLAFLDPYHFGIFGLTENLAYPSHPLKMARLQGYSLEPIHWAYFVFLTMAALMFVCVEKGFKKNFLFLSITTILILTYLFFVFSATAFLGMILWIGSLATILLCSFFGFKDSPRKLGFVIWTIVILMPGLILPFVLSGLKYFGAFIGSTNLLNKATNLSSRMEFLQFKEFLYSRITPYIADTPMAGQNLVLSSYLKFGYFFSLPLLGFLFILVYAVTVRVPPLVTAGSLLIFIANLIIVPPQFFGASGVMWFMMAYGMARFYFPWSSRYLEKEGLFKKIIRQLSQEWEWQKEHRAP